MLEPLEQVGLVQPEIEVGEEADRRALRDGPELDVAVGTEQPGQLVAERLEQAHQEVRLEAARHHEVALLGDPIDDARHLVAELGVHLALLGPEHLLDAVVEGPHAALHRGILDVVRRPCC